MVNSNLRNNESSALGSLSLYVRMLIVGLVSFVFCLATSILIITLWDGNRVSAAVVTVGIGIFMLGFSAAFTHIAAQCIFPNQSAKQEEERELWLSVDAEESEIDSSKKESIGEAINAATGLLAEEKEVNSVFIVTPSSITLRPSQKEEKIPITFSISDEKAIFGFPWEFSRHGVPKNYLAFWREKGETLIPIPSSLKNRKRIVHYYRVGTLPDDVSIVVRK